jgi:predicted secreted protein
MHPNKSLGLTDPCHYNTIYSQMVRLMLWHIGLTIVTVFFTLLSLTTGFAMMQNSPDGMTITERDNKSQIQIALGGILTVKLEAIPGTGYAWHVVRNDPGLLRPMGEAVFEPRLEDMGKKIVGAPEDQVFRFKAQSKGSDILLLEYVRKWEKKAAPLKTFSVTVQVN